MKILPYIPIIGLFYFAYQLLAKDRLIKIDDWLFGLIQMWSVLIYAIIIKL